MGEIRILRKLLPEKLNGKEWETQPYMGGKY